MTQNLANSIEVWTKVILRLGVPTAVAGVLLWLGQMAASALHQDVLVPGVQAHVKFLEKVTESQERQADSFEALAETKDQQTNILKELADSQKDIHAEIKALREADRDRLHH